MTTYRITLAAKLSTHSNYSSDTVAEHEIKLEVPDHCLGHLDEATLTGLMRMLLPLVAQSVVVERVKVKLNGEPKARVISNTSSPLTATEIESAKKQLAASMAASLQP